MSHARRILSLCGAGSRLVSPSQPGYRHIQCGRCGSVVGVDERTALQAPVECCVCGLVFYPMEDESLPRRWGQGE